MNLIADTNVLVRAIVADDTHQVQLAQRTLTQADIITVPVPVLCELCWVLKRGYSVDRANIADAIRKLVASANVVSDRAAVEAGLRILEAGGDFADGVIAQQGRLLGADTLVTCDVKAARLLDQIDQPVLLLQEDSTA